MGRAVNYNSIRAVFSAESTWGRFTYSESQCDALTAAPPLPTRHKAGMAFHVAVMMMMLMLPGFVSTRVPGSHIGSSVALPAPSYEFLEEHSGSLTVDHPPPPPPLLLLHATHNPTGSHRGHARHQPGDCARAPCRNDGLCHETADGKWRCECRHGFAGELCTEVGASLHCERERMRVAVPAALLAWRGWDAGALRLASGRCRAGSARGEPAMHSLAVDDSSGPCGTSVQHNDSHVWFSNAVLVEQEEGGDATAILNFTCVYGLETLAQLPFAVMPTLHTLTVRGEPGSFHVTMQAFVNASFDEGDLYRDGDTVMAGERVYVELRLAAPPGSPFYIFSRDCWARRSTTQTRDLGTHSSSTVHRATCPNEPEVVLHGANGNGSTVRFSLLAFRFVSDRRQQQQQRRRVVVPLPDVYLHCLVRVCVHAKSATADLCATLR
ncbi:uromodulin-like [Lampetra fluviatilis]